MGYAIPSSRLNQKLGVSYELKKKKKRLEAKVSRVDCNKT